MALAEPPSSSTLASSSVARRSSSSVSDSTYQLRVERGETVVVGVNRFDDGREPPVIPAPDFSALERDQVARLRAIKGARDGAAVTRALAALDAAAASVRPDGAGTPPAMMPMMIDAVRARATVVEVADTLERRWGKYQPR